MPEYLFQARNPEGKQVNEQIEAPDLSRARYALEARGYREIQFLDSEISADIRQAIRADTGVQPPPKGIWTPDDQVRSRQQRGTLAMLWAAFCRHFAAIGPLLAWNLWSLFNHAGAYTWKDWAGFVATPLYLAWFLLLCAPRIVFHQMLEAAIWYDWDRQRVFIRLARFLNKVRKTGIPERELIIREANSLAARGQLSDALQLMEKVRMREGKEYLFLARLAGVYQVAGSHDRQIACMREAQQKAPAGASMLVDLAGTLIRHGHDLPGAKQALAQARQYEMNKLTSAYSHFCEGMIAVEEKDSAHAKTELEAARAGLAGTGTPLTIGTIGLIEAYLCLACAGLGDKSEAARLGRKVEPLLRARRENELLGRCQAAMGGA